MYLNKKTCDVNFSFTSIDGTVKRVRAHKGVLAASSDVFESMLYGKLKKAGDIHLTDSTEAAFMEFLQFFYLDKIDLTTKNIAAVMHLGYKYNVKNCINGCVEFLEAILTTENVFIGLDLAFLYDHTDLLKFCEEIIIVDTAAVLESTDFLNCSKRLLDHILTMDVLSCSEAEVFEACMS